MLPNLKYFLQRAPGQPEHIYQISVLQQQNGFSFVLFYFQMGPPVSQAGPEFAT